MRRTLRHRTVRAVVAVAIAVAVSTALQGQWRAADEQRRSWGVADEVLVVDEPVAAGAPLASSVSLQTRPAAMVPVGAANRVGPHAVAAVDLVAGELLLTERIAGMGDDLTPAGAVAISVAVDRRAALVDAGDLVDLWLADQQGVTARPIATAVVVLHRDDDILTVAATDRDVGRIVAAGRAPVTVVRR